MRMCWVTGSARSDLSNTRLSRVTFEKKNGLLVKTQRHEHTRVIASYLPLCVEECCVVEPDPGHLMHEDEGALERVVYLLIDRIGDDPTANLVATKRGKNRAPRLTSGRVVQYLLPPELQVIVPQLVGARQFLECPLVDHVDRVVRALAAPLFVSLEVDVAQPRLERVRIAQQLLLEGQVLLGEHYVHRRRLRHLEHLAPVQNVCLFRFCSPHRRVARYSRPSVARSKTLLAKHEARDQKRPKQVEGPQEDELGLAADKVIF